MAYYYYDYSDHDDDYQDDGVPRSEMRLNSLSEDSPLEKIWQSMEIHPEYYHAFQSTHNLLMGGMGSLNHTKRNFIAIMAVSRHWCHDLINIHYLNLQRSLQATVLHSGPVDRGKEQLQEWYNRGFSLQSAPAKLRQIDKVNKILAHRPWMINKYHIRDLCVKSEQNGNECWTLSEVIQALTLLAHFHSFASYILGCGSMCQPSDKEVLEKKTKAAAAAAAAEGQTSPVETSSVGDQEDPDSSLTDHEDSEEVPLIKEKLETLGAMEHEDLEVEELNRRFEKIESSLTKDTPLDPQSEDQLQQRSRSQTPDQASKLQKGPAPHVGTDPLLIPTKFTLDLDFQYVDFVKREHPGQYPTCRSLEYNWEEHAYPTLQQFCSNSDVSSVLDAKFSTIGNLTYRTIGSYTSVDTSLFRRAIQVYVQCLYGIRHDDYDYSLINELLPRRLKKYIKTVSCYPERCTNEEYQSIMVDFFSSEKVHVCLLVCEARLQSSLLYAYKAVSDYYMDKNC